jgi:superfamily I DNA/RNA helicase/mRNA-degrading endonuclease RelE of RelBE toxin-antitoxin system
MEFRIADTFTDSLARLAGDEQKAAKTTAFDLQMNPANPGMQFHRLDRARDANFWSVRVNRDIRLIVHKSESSLLLCYVDHHDKAYRWAERRKIERHPRTGAAQLVEVRELVKEITVPKYVEAAPAPATPKLLFETVPEDDLLGYGVPQEWLPDVRVATEDSLLQLADHLPPEAAEALLELATGGTPQVAARIGAEVDPFEHPDAMRRFRVMTNVEELERALEYPWEKWMVFLHPAQQDLVERDYSGPARVAGSAGTGKTIVALHRAVHLARQNEDARVLLTTFSETLARSLQTLLRRLISNEPRIGERLDVYSMEGVALRLYEVNFGRPQVATESRVRALLDAATGDLGERMVSSQFLWSEWSNVVDAWQLKTWEEYRDVRRLGRKTRLPEKRRAALWSVFENVRAELENQGLVTLSTVFERVTQKLAESNQPPYDFAVIDEAQDVGVAQLRFLAALGGGRPNSLFFAGDLGQRIFQQPFSWKGLGVDIRGRSRTLRINYRTSHQIRSQADRLLASELSDVDGIKEQRRGTVSVFNGPPPTIEVADTADEEEKLVSQWIQARLKEGLQPHEIGVFVRSEAQLPRARAAVELADAEFVTLGDTVETKRDHVSLSAMHRAKGLEFRAVVVMACDDEIIPLQERIETVADDADLEEVYDTERHLLYVACTRARDHLLVTGVRPGSEFLEDLVA